jgi:hypothetical protein
MPRAPQPLPLPPVRSHSRHWLSTTSARASPRDADVGAARHNATARSADARRRAGESWRINPYREAHHSKIAARTLISISALSESAARRDIDPQWIAILTPDRPDANLRRTSDATHTPASTNSFAATGTVTR